MIHTKAVEASVQAISPRLYTPDLLEVDHSRSPAENKVESQVYEDSRNPGLTGVVGYIHHRRGGFGAESKSAAVRVVSVGERSNSGVDLGVLTCGIYVPRLDQFPEVDDLAR